MMFTVILVTHLLVDFFHNVVISMDLLLVHVCLHILVHLQTVALNAPSILNALAIKPVFKKNVVTHA
jgi:hypothetical protein